MVRLTPDYQARARRPGKLLYFRSALPLVALLLVFSLALAVFALLSHSSSPVIKQKIGWQAWDTVQFKSSADKNESFSQNSSEILPSIPLDNWDPLAMHTTGITEIAVIPCYFPPYLFPSYCAPATTQELDKTKGKWVRVERDLNQRTGLWYLNVYYRRTRRLDVPLIAHLQVLPEPPPADVDLTGWVKGNGNLHSGIWPSQNETRIWYKPRDQLWDGWKKAHDDADIITEIDVVYGDDDPFFGFQRVPGGKVTEGNDRKWDSVDLAFRRGNPSPPKAHTPQFHLDGTYKIMQISDLHYSVGPGLCRDTDRISCTGDEDTAAWLAEALDAEKPDLVVYTGDQLNGQATSYDARSVLAKFAKPVIERHIPWAAVFGNHDSEIADDRVEQMRALQSMPYSLARAGPEHVDGVGNYDIKLYSGDPSRTHIFTLYFLDSHANQKGTLPWSKADYDYLKTSQIEWYLNASSAVALLERPFQPDGAHDLPKLWSSRGTRTRQSKSLSKPNAIMFFHIPLPEAYGPADSTDDYRYPSGELDRGHIFDDPGASTHNSGFFYNGIKEAFETGDMEGNGDLFNAKMSEVKVLSHGHCHNTDRCRRIDGIWMCFGGGSSFSGYGMLGFDRRVRIYNISQWGETISTYKRLTNGEIIDRQVLLGDGAPTGWGGNAVDDDDTM